jgi:hypothetical protein
MCGEDQVLEAVQLEVPEGCNVVLGMSHFIKTVEDLYEAIANTIPGGSFGLAFSEASGPRLVRYDGTDNELVEIAQRNIMSIGAGHTFVLILKDAFPIQVLNAIKAVPEVCRVFCATANPVQVMVARTDQGGAVLGVVDGGPPTAVESPEDVEARKELLRKFGYKR